MNTTFTGEECEAIMDALDVYTLKAIKSTQDDEQRRIINTARHKVELLQRFLQNERDLERAQDELDNCRIIRGDLKRTLEAIS